LSQSQSLGARRAGSSLQHGSDHQQERCQRDRRNADQVQLLLEGRAWQYGQDIDPGDLGHFMPETHVPLLLDVEHLEIFAALEVVHAWNQRDNLSKGKENLERGLDPNRDNLPPHLLSSAVDAPNRRTLEACEAFEIYPQPNQDSEGSEQASHQAACDAADQRSIGTLDTTAIFAVHGHIAAASFTKCTDRIVGAVPSAHLARKLTSAARTIRTIVASVRPSCPF